MMMINILLLSILPSALVIGFPENAKTTCVQSPAPIHDEAYGKILNCIRANMILKSLHNMNSNEKAVHHFVRKVY